MRYKVLLLMLTVIVFAGNLFAQTKEISVRIHFNVDEHTLDTDDETELKKLVDAAGSATYYEISINAHTDSDADTDYNKQLSARRAASVKAYLTARKINPKVVHSFIFGETKPDAANTSTEGKAQNRRAEVVMRSYQINGVNDLLKTVSPAYKQTFTVYADKENTIRGNKGTTVVIPANAICTKSGKVVTGPVTVEMQEFLKPADAAFNQLSTVSEGKMLESGGMFSIRAYANNEELELKKSAKMNVRMPTINMKNGMQLFTALKNAEGITEWKPTSVPFRPPVDEVKTVPFTRLNTTALARMLIPVQTPQEQEEASFIYDLPSKPLPPEKVGKQPKYVPPYYNSMFPWYKRWFTSADHLKRRFDTETGRRQRAYQLKLNAHERRINDYKKYVADSIRYCQVELVAFRDWLIKQKQLHTVWAEYKEKEQWNNAIRRLIERSNANLISQVNIKEQFLSQIGPVTNEFAEIYGHKTAISIIDFFLSGDLYNSNRYFRVNGKVNLHYSNIKITQQPRHSIATFAQAQLHNNAELMTMLHVAKSDLVKKYTSAKEFDESKVGNVYATSLSNFGTFNCDRFFTLTPQQMAAITVPYDGEARVAFFVPSLNSYMYANRNEMGYSVSLPKGIDVKVIFVSYTKENGPVIQIEKTRFYKNTVVNLKPKRVTLQEMQQQLTAI